MTDANYTIVDLLRKIVAGGRLSDADLKSTSWTDFDDRHKKDSTTAWAEIQQWVWDEDLRAKDAEYAEMRLSRLKRFLSILDSHGSE